MKSLFRNHTAAPEGTALIVDTIKTNLKGKPSLIEPAVAGKAIAMEGLNDSGVTAVDEALQSFRNILNGIKGVKLSVAQEEAANVSAVIGSNPRAFVQSKPASAEAIRAGAQSQGQSVIVVPSLEGMDRIPAMEAFDERENRNAMSFTAAYNIQSARQNEFGEAFYPTVTVAPDQVGFNVNVRLLYTYDEVSRSATGSLNVFNRKNIIKAIIDATILQIEQTKLIPVYRTGGTDSSTNFVAGIATTTLSVDGHPLPTRPLAAGKKFSILGISQTDAALAAGQQDQSDAVDSSVRLTNVYLHLTDGSAHEYFKFETANMPTSDFNAAVQGNTRLLTMRFATKDLFLSAATKQVDGSSSTLLAPLGTTTVRLSVTANGEIVQDVGDTYVNFSPMSVDRVFDATGALLDQGSGAGQTSAAVFANAATAFVGYDLLAFRTNSNRRNRGKLLDVQHVNFLYTVPLLPPLTSLRPVTSQDSEDGNLLSNLVTATRIQTSNAAVTALLAAQTTLKANANVAAEVVASQPALFGAAALLVTPAYTEATFDVATKIDSLNDSQRIADLQMLLINKIRDMAARLYVQSGYGPALEAMYEGTPPKITIVIGTDPILHRYLTLNGDTRLVGDQFDYKIVASFDSRMAGQIIFSFGLEAAFNSGVMNPLHFGNLAWKPELTLMLPMVRNGAQVMELTVQPSFRHVTNLPIMGSLTVTNVDVVIGGKVAINNHPV
jgi:hypothetical protein